MLVHSVHAGQAWTQRPYPRTSHRESGASRASGPGTGLGPRALSSMPGKARLSEVLPSRVRIGVEVGALFVGCVQVCVGKSSANSSSSTIVGGVAMAVRSGSSQSGQQDASVPAESAPQRPFGVLSGEVWENSSPLLLTVARGCPRACAFALSGAVVRAPSLGSGVSEPPSLGLPPPTSIRRHRRWVLQIPRCGYFRGHRKTLLPKVCTQRLGFKNLEIINYTFS